MPELLEESSQLESTTVGVFSDIAVLPDGRPVIAYYDSDNEELRFAERSGSMAAAKQSIENWSTSRNARCLSSGSPTRCMGLFLKKRVAQRLQFDRRK